MPPSSLSPARKSGAARRPKRWELRLYVANWDLRSAASWASLKAVCDQYLPGLYRIELVELSKHPQRCRQDQILALPTLIRRSPLPQKRIIGRLSQPASLLAALEVPIAAGRKGSTE